jgi:hypothetical protein
VLIRVDACTCAHGCKSAPTDNMNMTRLVHVAELLVGVAGFVGLQLWLIYRSWRRHDASELEPMNLRIFVDDGGHWFICGFGCAGNGATPEDAMRDLVMQHNRRNSAWPVRELVLLEPEPK